MTSDWSPQPPTSRYPRLGTGILPIKADSGPGRVVDSSASQVSQGARPESWHLGWHRASPFFPKFHFLSPFF